MSNGDASSRASACMPFSAVCTCEMPRKRNCCGSSSRFAGWSSTTSTRSAADMSCAAVSGGTGGTGAACGSSCAASSGIVATKVLPLPCSLASSRLPPICAIRLWQIHSPRPVPFWRGAEPSVACSNGSKIRAWSSWRMPQPVSSTRTCKRPAAADQAASSVTDPWSVNFSALPSRLPTTWRRRSGSAISTGGMAPSIRHWKASPFSRASGRYICARRRSSVPTAAGCGDTVSWPASILE
ncbi:hypothetical protein D9M72_446980 [compost metagenome]